MALVASGKFLLTRINEDQSGYWPEVLGGTMKRVVIGLLVLALAAVSGTVEARTSKPYPGVTTSGNQSQSQSPPKQSAALTPSDQQILEKADRVVVLKSERKLVLMQGDRVLDVFTVALGRYAKGHKQREGDQRTPEGVYTLDEKMTRSNFYRAIHISYPNAQDMARAQRNGHRPGGLILIHGLPNGWGERELGHPKFDWTDGCIAVTNREMDRVWARVDPGTPIEIFP
jgi:murein L,D-transpeptidase YafK